RLSTVTISPLSLTRWNQSSERPISNGGAGAMPHSAPTNMPPEPWPESNASGSYPPSLNSAYAPIGTGCPYDGEPYPTRPQPRCPQWFAAAGDAANIRPAIPQANLDTRTMMTSRRMPLGYATAGPFLRPASEAPEHPREGSPAVLLAGSRVAMTTRRVAGGENEAAPGA